LKALHYSVHLLTIISEPILFTSIPYISPRHFTDILLECHLNTKSPSHIHTQANTLTLVVVAPEIFSRLPRPAKAPQLTAPPPYSTPFSQSRTPNSPAAVEAQETSTSPRSEQSSPLMKSSSASLHEREELKMEQFTTSGEVELETMQPHAQNLHARTLPVLLAATAVPGADFLVVSATRLSDNIEQFLPVISIARRLSRPSSYHSIMGGHLVERSDCGSRHCLR
jgi:hypothetical protein